MLTGLNTVHLKTLQVGLSAESIREQPSNIDLQNWNKTVKVKTSLVYSMRNRHKIQSRDPWYQGFTQAVHSTTLSQPYLRPLLLRKDQINLELVFNAYG